MNIYQQMISETVKCTPEVAVELVEIMRQDISHSTLDWQSRKQFNKGAREALELYEYMNSDEGKEYVKMITKEMEGNYGS